MIRPLTTKAVGRKRDRWGGEEASKKNEAVVDRGFTRAMVRERGGYLCLPVDRVS